MQTAYVNLWGKRMGALAWNHSEGTAAFEYDSQFVASGIQPAPLTMPAQHAGRIYSFPELRSTPTFNGLPGLLADALPDKYGNALINTWLARNGRTAGSLNPVETLCFIASRGMGALEFEPATLQASSKATVVEVEELVSIAQDLVSGRARFAKDLSQDREKALIDMLKIGTSAGGARAKAVIAYNPTTGQVRSGQTHAPAGFDHWLIKFDGVYDAQFGASAGYGAVEMAYCNMAKACGIEMMESRLLQENGRAHFMTRRFDRFGGKKSHIQTFCAMRHFDFQDINSFSYEQLFETMRMLGLPYPEAAQMFRRMAFNIMARNCDDHTKNFAFKMDEAGTWSLAPAYDLCHAFRPSSTWVSQHCLSANGKRKGFERQDLLAVGKAMNIKHASRALDEVGAVVRNWSSYADEVMVPTQLKKAIAGTLLPL